MIFQFKRWHFFNYVIIFATIAALLIGCDFDSGGGDTSEPAATTSPAAGEPTDTAPTSQLPEHTKVPSDGNINLAGKDVFPSAENALKEAVKNLKSGQVAFNVPQNMQVAETKFVEARVSDDLQRDLK